MRQNENRKADYNTTAGNPCFWRGYRGVEYILNNTGYSLHKNTSLQGSY